MYKKYHPIIKGTEKRLARILEDDLNLTEERIDEIEKVHDLLRTFDPETGKSPKTVIEIIKVVPSIQEQYAPWFLFVLDPKSWLLPKLTYEVKRGIVFSSKQPQQVIRKAVFALIHDHHKYLDLGLHLTVCHNLNIRPPKPVSHPGSYSLVFPVLITLEEAMTFYNKLIVNGIDAVTTLASISTQSIDKAEDIIRDAKVLASNTFITSIGHVAKVSIHTISILNDGFIFKTKVAGVSVDTGMIENRVSVVGNDHTTTILFHGSTEISCDRVIDGPSEIRDNRYSTEHTIHSGFTMAYSPYGGVRTAPHLWAYLMQYPDHANNAPWIKVTDFENPEIGKTRFIPSSKPKDDTQ